MDTLLVEHPRPGVALVTLNRPERLNALNKSMFDGFRQLMLELDTDPDTKVVVLTGAGRGFCAGKDLNEVADTNALSIGERLLRIDDDVASLMRVRLMSTPTIAAVNGPAHGGGMSLAVACDMRVASASATFGVAFVNIGISSGDAGLSWALPRLIGHGLAADLMFTGRVIGAEESLRMGLVNRVVEPDRLLDEALGMAEAVAAHDMLAIWMTKRTLNASANLGLNEAIAMENTAQVIAMDSDTARKKNAEFLNNARRA